MHEIVWTAIRKEREGGRERAIKISRFPFVTALTLSFFLKQTFSWHLVCCNLPYKIPRSKSALVL